MKRGRWLGGLLALGFCVVCVEPAAADRTGGVRSGGQRNTGTRPDITVPYLNNGTNAFNAANVKPKIYSSPIVDDAKNPQSKPVFNLIFYGSKQNFGDKSDGAGPCPANTLRPGK